MKPTRAFLLAALLLTACVSSERAAQQKAAREHYTIGKAKMEAYCKIAGEKIYKTVDNVEGVYLLKIRPGKINFGDQFRMDDPYGHDSGGDLYIESFLRLKIKPKKPMIPGAPPRNGYLWVEAIDPQDGVRYRYTGRWFEPWQTDKHYLQGYMKFVMDKAPATGPAPRYGVTYDDISTREDRESWIAGSSLRVIDLQTQEVLAERIGYMWDPGQGNNSGGRSPWLLAARYACPGFNRYPAAPRFTMQAEQTEDFVEKVLIPKLD